MGLGNLHEGQDLQPNVLSALQKLVNSEGKYPIVVVADEAMMRGVDYRSDGKGLLLVVAKSFSTNRDAEQGLARVGRFGDNCARMLVTGVEIVDANLNAAKYSVFFRFAESCIAANSKQQKKRQAKAAGKQALICNASK
jgi:hypothetical protein